MLSRLPMLLSFAREAKALWDDLEGNDRDRLDQLFRKGMTILPTPARVAQVRGYLIESKEPLPVRLAAAALHPEVRLMFAEGLYAPDQGYNVDEDDAFRRLMARE